MPALVSRLKALQLEGPPDLDAKLSHLKLELHRHVFCREPQKASDDPNILPVSREPSISRR